MSGYLCFCTCGTRHVSTDAPSKGIALWMHLFNVNPSALLKETTRTIPSTEECVSDILVSSHRLRLMLSSLSGKRMVLLRIRATCLPRSSCWRTSWFSSSNDILSWKWNIHLVSFRRGFETSGFADWTGLFFCCVFETSRFDVSTRCIFCCGFKASRFDASTGWICLLWIRNVWIWYLDWMDFLLWVQNIRIRCLKWVEFCLLWLTARLVV